jgi:hypothetical protein
MTLTHLIIPDAHAHPDYSNDRFTWLGKLIGDVRPDVVINIGDWFDLPSLCVTPDTKILMSDMTWVDAGEIEIGGSIIGFDEQGVTYPRKFKHGLVTQNTKFISVKGFKVVTTHGTIRCSYDHKFFSHNQPLGAKKGFRTCSDLKVGWKIVSLGSDWSAQRTSLSDLEIGYLRGFLDGEGYYGNGRLSWSQNNGPVSDYVLSLFEKLEFNVQWYEENLRPNLRHFYIQGSYLNSWKALQLIRPIRLMKTFLQDIEGKTCSKFSGIEDATIISIEEISNIEVVGLETDVGTYISNNLFSHNCSYDKGTKSFEGRRLRSDLDHGRDAIDRVMTQVRRTKRRLPRFVSLEGNHEFRLTKAIEANPVELDSMINVSESFGFTDYNWEYVPYVGKTPACFFLDNILYAHYLTRAGSDRAVSTEHHAYNLIYESMVNTVVGHKHTVDWAVRTKSDNTLIQGICVGNFMDYQPGYAGESAKHWWSGVVLLENLEPDTGYFEPRFITMKSIKREYSD